jgi:hypothetical protein
MTPGALNCVRVCASSLVDDPYAVVDGAVRVILLVEIAPKQSLMTVVPGSIEASRSHFGTPQSVVLLWTSDQSSAETSP